MEKALTFNEVTFQPVIRNGQPWIQSRQLAVALGYKDENSVRKIYKRNSDEFTEAMTVTVKMTVGITPVDVRIFSLRGCHLLAMFARTPVAKAFRKWVLDVLDSLNDGNRPALPSPRSRRSDPERKALTAIINTWVGMAPIHYAAARAQVNAHFGVASVDELTVAQVQEALRFVQAKIDALPQPQEQKAIGKTDALYETGKKIEDCLQRMHGHISALGHDTSEIWSLLSCNNVPIMKGMYARSYMWMRSAQGSLFEGLHYIITSMEQQMKGLIGMAGMK